MALSGRQQAFVREYLIDLDAGAAAARAGYSAKTAYSSGPRLLTYPKVKAAIDEAQRAQVERVEAKADLVVRELLRIALADPRKVAKWGADGLHLLDSAELDDDAAAAVESVSFSESTTEHGGSKSVKFKLHSKTAALKLLGDHLGLWKEKTPLDEILDALPADLRDALRSVPAPKV